MLQTVKLTRLGMLLETNSIVRLCRKLVPDIQSINCSQNFHPDVAMTIFRNCASVLKNISLYTLGSQIKIWMSEQT